MAQQYVLADNAFQTQGSDSFTAHQDLIAGGTAIDSYESIIDDPTYWPWGCDGPPGVENVADRQPTVSISVIKGRFHASRTQRFAICSTPRRSSWKFYATKVMRRQCRHLERLRGDRSGVQ